MNRILFNRAMSNIDEDIVEAFLENKRYHYWLSW